MLWILLWPQRPGWIIDDDRQLPVSDASAELCEAAVCLWYVNEAARCSHI